MKKMTSGSIGFTQINVDRSQYTWKVKKFSSLYFMKEPETKLISPSFTVKPNDDIKWQLILWPNGHTEDYSNFLSASISNPSNNHSRVHVQFALSILDHRGQKRFEQSKEMNSNIRYDGFNEFVKRSTLLNEANDILVNDVLTIFCEIWIMRKDSVGNFDESFQQQPSCFDRKVLDAFEKQLHKEEFSDVKLVASCGKELRAHKFVLAAHSPVFSAMFTNNMKEKDDNEVVIKDLDYNSLKEMLRFMYAGKVVNLAESLNGVLAAQEKYQIDGLKEYCEEYLFQNINIENAVEVLALSIRYDISKAKFLSTKFIQCHGKDICETDSFNAIEEPKLLAEIVRILANI